MYSVIPGKNMLKLYSRRNLTEAPVAIPPTADEWLHECACRIHEAVNLEDKEAELSARLGQLKAYTDVYDTFFTKHHWCVCKF